MEYIDSTIRIMKTWAYGAAALTIVMAFMPFAATMIFLSPFYDLSPIQVKLVLHGSKDDCEDDETVNEENDDETVNEEDDETVNEENDDETVNEENDDETVNEENDDETVSVEDDMEVTAELNEYIPSEESICTLRKKYIEDIEENAEEARVNGYTDKAEQFEDVARILRTLWYISESVKTNEQSEEKPDTTPLREAVPLPEDDRIAFMSGTGKTGQTYTVDAIVEENKDKDA